MNVLDSSGWIEYFEDGPNADIFEPVALDTRNLIVPTIALYEVFKFTLRNRDEKDAHRVVATMRRGRVVVIDESLAYSAAKLGLTHLLAMADSLILAVAREYDALLWTQDDDFQFIPGVRYFAKPGK